MTRLHSVTHMRRLTTRRVPRDSAGCSRTSSRPTCKLQDFYGRVREQRRDLSAMFMIGVTFAQMSHISSTQTQKLPDIPLWLAILMLTLGVLYIVVRIKDYTESTCTLNLQDRDGLGRIARHDQSGDCTNQGDRPNFRGETRQEGAWLH
jgi:hypothetical protein